MIKQKASEILSEIDGEKKADILTIIAIITAIIKLMNECKKSNLEITMTMNSPGIYTRWRLRRIVNSLIPEKEEREKVYLALLHTGRWIRQPDVAAMQLDVK